MQNGLYCTDEGLDQLAGITRPYESVDYSEFVRLA
jgi:hypothetical protein